MDSQEELRRQASEAMRALGRLTSEAKAASARANGAKGGRPRKPAPPEVESFFSRVLQAEPDGGRQTAWHEAGHMLVWRLAWPDRPAHYGVWRGVPGVIPDAGGCDYVVADLSPDEVRSHIAVKLAGYCAEMVALGIDHAAEEIGAYVARDMQSRRPRLDWADDARHGGDLSQARRLMRRSPASLPRAMGDAMRQVCALLRERYAELSREALEVLGLLKAWQGAQ